MKYVRFIATVTLSLSVLAGSLVAADSPSAAAAWPGPEVVDRVAATVNQEPVLASDVQDAASIEALMQGKPAAQITAADMHSALERLIDRTLIRQQMSAAMTGFDQQARRRLDEIRASLPGAASDAAWKTILSGYGLDEPKLSRYLQDQFEILHFVDVRLRPGTDVAWREIQSYYNEKFLPELKQRETTPEPLSHVQAQIREILLQQKIDDQLGTWLASLRSQGGVRILQPPLETAQGAGSSRKGMSFSILERR
jgi:hypothetical protein